LHEWTAVLRRLSAEIVNDIRIDPKGQPLLDGAVEFAPHSSRPVQDFRDVVGVDLVVRQVGDGLQLRPQFRRQGFPEFGARLRMCLLRKLSAHGGCLSHTDDAADDPAVRLPGRLRADHEQDRDPSGAADRLPPRLVRIRIGPRTMLRRMVIRLFLGRRLGLIVSLR